jgi:Putative Ig domain
VALGTPYVVGSAAFASGTTSTVVSVSHASTLGDAITVCCSTGSNTVTPSAVTDSKSNTYTQLSTASSSNSMDSYVFQALNATALTTSDTITVTWNSTSNGKNVVAIGCSGVATSSAFDVTATNQGSGTALTASTGTLASTSELAVAVAAFGNAGTSITWASGWTQRATVHAGSALYTSVATQAETSTAAVTAAATLGASASWSDIIITLKAAAAGGAITITPTSLPSGTVGTSYAQQLSASGGQSPYTWAVSAGSLPTGLSLSAGSSGGGNTSILHVAANGGPDGTSGQSFTDYQTAQTTIGPLTGIKLFVSGDLPSDWTQAVWSTGISVQQVVTTYPNVVPILAWNGPGGTSPSSAATITAFCNSIPTGVSVGFDWQQEPENPSSAISAAQFVSGFQQTANAIHALKRTNTDPTSASPGLFTITSSAWGQYGPTGDAISGNYLPGPSYVDIYAIDIYQHELGGSFNGATTWSTGGLSNSAFFQNWLGLVQKFGQPLAITEYGIDNTVSNAMRAQRLQDDYSYLKAAFNGGAASPYPLFMWLYWWHNMATSNTQYKFTDTTAVNTWKGIAAGSASSGGSSTGGLISGTPSTTAGSPFSFTVQATDSASVSGTQAESITVSVASALTVTTTSPLPGATTGSAYTTTLTASGGTAPYTWSLQSGTLPAGLAISGQTITGTPTTPGTSSFVLKVTDNVAATATLSASLTVLSTLAITTTGLPGATAGTAYTATVVATGGVFPYTFAITSGALPAGLVLDTDGSVTGTAGTITGTPTGGSSSFTVTATDTAGATASAQLAITVTGISGGGTVGRRKFGGGISDFTITASGSSITLAPSATVIFFNALTAGAQYTDLTGTAGNAITSVTSDANGEIPEFYGPVGIWKMAADGNGGAGPRRWMTASDMGDQVSGLVSQVTSLVPVTGSAGTVTLNGTTPVTVFTSAITTSSLVFLTVQAAGGTPGIPSVSGRTAGISFSVVSASASDTSTLAWSIQEPA